MEARIIDEFMKSNGVKHWFFIGIKDNEETITTSVSVDGKKNQAIIFEEIETIIRSSIKISTN